MTRPDRNPVPPMKEFPVPINRKGLPVQPLWLLSVLSVLSAAALACGLAWGTGVVTVPATAVQAVAGTVCAPALLPVPGTAHDALDADPAAIRQHGTAVHHRYACGTPPC